MIFFFLCLHTFIQRNNSNNQNNQGTQKIREQKKKTLVWEQEADGFNVAMWDESLTENGKMYYHEEGKLATCKLLCACEYIYRYNSSHSEWTTYDFL